MSYSEGEVDLAEKHPLGSGYAWRVWVLATVFVVWLFNLQTSYSILQGDVQHSIAGLTLTQIALIASAYTWVFAIAQFFSGALLDRLGGRRILIPAMVLEAVGAVLFATAQNFTMLLVSQVVLALGACCGFVGAGYVGGQWFGMAKFGLMFGLVQVVASFSSALGDTGFHFVLEYTSWRGLLWGFVIFGVVLIVCSLIWLRDPKKIDVSGFKVGKFFGDVSSNIWTCLKNPQVIMSTLVGAAFFGLQLALGVVWLPNLAAAHGLSHTISSLTAAALWLGLAVGAGFVNQWSDKWQSRKKPYIILNIIAILMLAGFAWLPLSPALALTMSFVFGVTNGSHMLSFTIAGDVVPVELIGTASSIVNGAMFIASGIFMAIPGWMLPKTGTLTAADFNGPMAVFVGLGVVGTLILFFMKESFPKEAA